jgi:hypothetical protein
MVSSTGTGIDAVLDSNFPDVNTMATYTTNLPPSPVSSTILINGYSGYGTGPFFIGQEIIATGEIGRISYDCTTEYYCGEQNLVIDDGTNTYYIGDGPNTGTLSSYGSYRSDTMSPTLTDIPNGGILGPGTYDFFVGDPGYGDGATQKVTLETTSLASFPTTYVAPTDTNLFNGRSNGNTAYQSQSYVLDLADANTPVLGTNSGFGGVSLGGASGEFNLVCVTTAGHVMFIESAEPACTPDAVESSAGGQWQGFALGAGKTNFQYQGSGMLWQIRDI